MHIELSENGTHTNKCMTFFLKEFFRWRLCICWVKYNFFLVHKFLSLLLNEFLQSENITIWSKISLALLQLLINNQVQFVCSWCCVPPDFVVQINNSFSLIPFSAVIHQRRGTELIRKIVKYKLDSSSKMQVTF